ncbi:unnamed protein product [Adineta steineri]|uniref:Uncharacterized protein n=1 Tax=Adineta steineri TaxID=433720 RepID=A0A816DF38_9BILA|nr:unnamed protein product [Adineta steineri]CAF1635535.1 unnamed protein product [Adineta steineri]
MATRSKRKFVEIMLNEFVNIQELATLSKFYVEEPKRLKEACDKADSDDKIKLKEEKALSKEEAERFGRIYEYFEKTGVIKMLQDQQQAEFEGADNLKNISVYSVDQLKKVDELLKSEDES